MIDPSTLDDEARIAYEARQQKRAAALLAEEMASMTEWERAKATVAAGEPYFAGWRVRVVSEAPRDLALLGVKNAPRRWALAVIFTRAWLLGIASAGSSLLDSPLGEYQLFRYVSWHAVTIAQQRRKRGIGGADTTRADLDEARCALEIDNARWDRARTRAAWVLRDLPEAM